MEVIVAILAIIGFMFFRRKSLNYQIKKTIKSEDWYRKTSINFSKVEGKIMDNSNGALIPLSWSDLKGSQRYGIIKIISVDNTPYMIGAVESSFDEKSTLIAVLPFYESHMEETKKKIESFFEEPHKYINY